MIPTYKIIEATVKHFKGIEMPYDFSEYKIGDSINILGLDMHLMQLGSEIVGCSNSENILILQKLSD
jgi:hypothetical protein